MWKARAPFPCRLCVATRALFAHALLVSVFAHWCAVGAVGAVETPPAAAPPSVAGLDELTSLIASGRYAEAEARARLLLANVEVTHGRESREVAQVLEGLIEALWRGGKISEPETRALAERAVAIREAVLGADHPELANSLTHLGIVHLLTGDAPGAHPLAERSLEIRRKSLAPDHPNVATALNFLAAIEQRLGQFENAARHYEEALGILGRQTKPNDALLAAGMNNLAMLHTQRGDYVRGKALFERSLALQEKIGQKDFLTRLNLANVLHESGDTAGADTLYAQALFGAETALGTEHPDVATILNSYGGNCVLLGQVDRGRAFIERALRIREKTLGPKHVTLAASLNNLADVLRRQGELAAAEAALRRAIEIWNETLGEDHPESSIAHASLAEVLAEAGALDEARTEAERARFVRERTLGSNHPLVGRSLFSLAEIDRKAGRFTEALDEAQRAESVARENLWIALRGASQDRVLKQLDSWSAVREVLQGIAFGLGPNAGTGLLMTSWDAIVRSRGLVLAAVAERNRLVRSAATPEGAALREAYEASIERYAVLLVQGDASEHGRVLVASAQEEVAKLEEEILAACASCDRRFEGEEVGLDAVWAALPLRSALVAFTRFEEAYGAFVVAKRDGGEPHVSAIVLGPAAEIDPLVVEWRASIVRGSDGRDLASAEAECRRLGEQLRAKVWDPVSPFVAASTRVFLVPDGSLNLVSFAALPVGERGFLLDEDRVLHVLGAERDLARDLHMGNPGEGCLVLGDPDFDSVTTEGTSPAESGARATGGAGVVFRGQAPPCEGFAEARWSALPETAREIEDVEKAWEKTAARAPGKEGTREPITIHTSGDASERTLKMEAPGKRVLHIATHGFLVEEGCAPVDRSVRGMGGLVAEQAGSAAVVPPALAHNPLQLSGLVLAGANQRASAGATREDGILTAEEVAAMDLDGVEWAVLSACGTGVGKVRVGEGVFGLRRAFREAGVGTTILSLWPVADEPTREWMRSLYEARLGRQLATADAVYEATVASLATARKKFSGHPFYWAGFVAAGEWR